MTTPNESTGEGGERRIVVGVDGSACGMRALEFAAHEAGRWGALLQICCAYEIPATATWVTLPLEPFAEAAAAIVNLALDRVHQIEPTVVTKGEHRHGFAGAVLVGESRGASLLVVGSRGHGELANILIGSVSQHCVHQAPCPVTVVR